MIKKTQLITLILFTLTLMSFISGDKKPKENPYIIATLDSKKLDVNNISTWFRNDGSFNRNPNGNAGFEWPKNSLKYARYVSGIWLGAKVGNDTLITHAFYDSQYLPGYIDNNGMPMGRDDPLYRIYKIERGDTLSPDYLNWPVSQGAYTNSIGKPFLLGTQTMFYAFTDGYKDHHVVSPGNTAPLKAQILQTNWAYSNVNLRDVIFTEFRIINRSNVNWDNAYFGFWTDDDLGYFGDDAIAIDTVRNLTYTYNYSNYDPAYGSAPPCVGILLLRSPVKFTNDINDSVKYFQPPGSSNQIIKARSKFTGLTVFNDSRNKFEKPRNYIEAYRFFEGKKADNTPWINPVTNLPTVKVYSGDPVTGTGWNMSGGSERRTLTSFGNITVLPNDTQSVIIAQVIARGTSNLNSITKLRDLSDHVQSVYDNNFQNVLSINTHYNELTDGFKLRQNFPNPFNPNTVISYELPFTGFAKLSVYDILGNEVAELVNDKQNAGSYEVKFNGENIASGVYFYKLTAGKFSETKRMILIK